MLERQMEPHKFFFRLILSFFLQPHFSPIQTHTFLLRKIINEIKKIYGRRLNEFFAKKQTNKTYDKSDINGNIVIHKSWIVCLCFKFGFWNGIIFCFAIQFDSLFRFQRSIHSISLLLLEWILFLAVKSAIIKILSIGYNAEYIFGIHIRFQRAPTQHSLSNSHTHTYM